MRRITEKDLADIIGTVNVGYTIVRAKTKADDHYGIVLARSGDSWVTWEFNYRDGEIPNFYWGHFLSDEAKALADYEERG